VKYNVEQVFPVEPRAILPFEPIPGQVPRKVAIDRKRKEFKGINFEELLASVVGY
jgi:dynein heavy chain